MKVIELRGDDEFLYFRTDTYEFIRIDKSKLLAGSIETKALSSAEWATKPRQQRPQGLQEYRMQDISVPGKDAWMAENIAVETTGAYCQEGLNDLHMLKIDHKKVDTGLDPCMSLVNPVALGRQIWFGTTRPGEYGNGPGVGILVFDLQKKRRIAKLKTQLVGNTSGFMLEDRARNGVWVVNNRAVHFFDSTFKRRALAYYSEQFDPQGMNWSMFHMSTTPERHNPFAVAARLIMTPPNADRLSDEDYEKALGVKRWLASAGVKEYQARVKQLPQRIKSLFWIEYDEFERTYFPRWGRDPMTYENGGREFLGAWQSIACLYETADSPWMSDARHWVIRIASAVLKLNSSDEQLYEPKCTMQH